MEVNLEKTPSGTWKVPESPKRQFKPWQRLWIVTAIIYLLMLAGCYYVIMPNQESIERKMVFAVTEEVRRYDRMAFAGESPRNIFEIARSQGYSAWITKLRSRYQIGPEGNDGFDKIEKNFQKERSDLPVKHAIGLLVCLVAWLLPMAALYGAGFVLDWIKRGVRGIRG